MEQIKKEEVKNKKSSAGGWENIEPSDKYNETFVGNKVYRADHISLGRPDEAEWFSVYGDSWKDVRKATLVKLKIDHEILDHLVFGPPEFVDRVKQDFKKFRQVRLIYWATKKGRMGIWLLAIPRKSKLGNFKLSRNGWIDSATQIIEKGFEIYIRVASNLEQQYYEGWDIAPETLEDFGGKKHVLSYYDATLKAFDERVLTPDNYDDHPYVKELIRNPINVKAVEDDE